MATLTKGYTFGATESVTNAKLSALVDDATISGIVNADVAVGAAIAEAKLDISGIVLLAGAQEVTGAKTFSGGIIEGTANQGDIWYDDGTDMHRLTPGTSGEYLQTKGASANPVWATASAGAMVQMVNVMDGAVAVGTTVMPKDDTIPQNTEGTEFITLAITPTSATNNLRIDVVIVGSANANSASSGYALFQDTTAGALAAVFGRCSYNSEDAGVVSFTHWMTAGTTSETTFKVRVGHTSGTSFTFNGYSAGTRIYGGVAASSITITEIKV